MAEADLADIASTLEEIQKAKTEAEERAAYYARERAQLQSQLDENEEELAEVRSLCKSTELDVLLVILAEFQELSRSNKFRSQTKVKKIEYQTNK